MSFREDLFDNSNSRKLVIRDLPPLLTKKEFIEYLESIPCSKPIWIDFVKGTVSKTNIKYSTVYILLNTVEDTKIFAQWIKTIEFVDSSNNKSFPIVEYAFYQPQSFLERNSKIERKPIEKNSTFQSFIAMLKEQPENELTEQQHLDQINEDGNLDSKEIVPPIIQRLQQKERGKMKRNNRKRKQLQKNKQQKKQQGNTDTERGNFKAIGGNKNRKYAKHNKNKFNKQNSFKRDDEKGTENNTGSSGYKRPKAILNTFTERDLGTQTSGTTSTSKTRWKKGGNKFHSKFQDGERIENGKVSNESSSSQFQKKVKKNYKPKSKPGFESRNDNKS
eukprot:TRINITY_DN7404_c0_g1_i1.p1 TRINITY_DN7404_c0_g1~~TRINITY_DN7404_c0_g1_i1.p1  ORF type:complete len:344 (+),score=118.32 TRINITY_DN7404_c0_g1_i1:35-1033(+)